MYEFPELRSWFCSAEGEAAEAAGGSGAVDTPSPAPASAEAAQAALAASDKKPTLLTDAEKPAEKTAEAEPVFTADKLVLPEGFEPDKTVLENFGKIVEGLPHKTAQALADLYAQSVKDVEQKNLDAWKDTRGRWEAEARGWNDDEVKNAKFYTSDKTISGLDAMVLTVKKVLDNPQLTDPKFKEALEFSGLGSNPATIRTLYRWASQLVEGGPTAGANPAGAGAKDAAGRNAAEILYPNLAKG